MPLEFRLPRRRSSAMSVTRQLRPMALGVAIVATLGLGACATYDDDFARVNSRLDQLDTSVQSAAQSAEAANQSAQRANQRSEEHTSELQSLMRTSYAVFCLKKKTKK